MGFGMLFVGYFLLINITYFEYTDIIAAMLMLMATYKLSFVNKYFKYAMITSAVFAFFALGELSLSLINFFLPLGFYEATLSYISFTRYALTFILVVFLLRGISTVCEEVELISLKRFSDKCLKFSFIYLLAGFFEIPFTATILGGAAAYVYLAAILAFLIFHGFILYAIYKAFRDILMPEAESQKKEKKPSFTDKLWNRIEEGNREYAEYKLNKKNSKKGKRK